MGARGQVLTNGRSNLVSRDQLLTNRSWNSYVNLEILEMCHEVRWKCNKMSDDVRFRISWCLDCNCLEATRGRQLSDLERRIVGRDVILTTSLSNYEITWKKEQQSGARSGYRQHTIISISTYSILRTYTFNKIPNTRYFLCHENALTPLDIIYKFGVEMKFVKIK